MTLEFPGDSKLALEGISIVEYGSRVAGPYCGKLLADAGARVVKIEPPGGEDLRHPVYSFAEEEQHTREGLFQFLNTNKRGVTLDLSSPLGRRTFLDLLTASEVLIWNGTPQMGREQRLRYRDLRSANSRLVVTAITPFGLKGPYRHFKGDEFIVYNLGGLGYACPGLPDYAENHRTEPPLHPRAPVADIITGLMGAVGTMMALATREHDGQGREVDVSGMDAVASMMGRDTSVYAYIREITGRLPNKHVRHPNAILRCKDGWVVIATPYGHHWDSLVKVMGNPEWASLEVFADGLVRGTNWDALKPLIEQWTLRYTGQEVLHMTQAMSIPCFPAFTLGQMIESEQTAAREYLWDVPVGSGLGKVPGPPFKLEATPHSLRTTAPALGEHNDEKINFSAPISLPALKPGKPRAPLEGVRVLDLGQIVSVPHCGRMLAWMGADVINVESTKRVTGRNNPPFSGDGPGLNTSAMYNGVGTNKRSCTLNLTTPQGVELFNALVRVSDVVLENYATRTISKLGLDYETLRQVNPGIILLSLSAFGRTGPMKGYVGLHSAANMFSGVAQMTGYHAGDRPRILGAILPDPLSGTAACLAILEALNFRRRTGRGQYIDLSMSETFTNLIPEAVADYSNTARRSAPQGNRDPYRAPQGVYRCKGKDHWVAISVSTDGEWRNLCGAIGESGLVEDPRFKDWGDRWRHHNDLDAIITRWTRVRSHYEAMHSLQDSGVPAGAVLDPKDLLNDPHMQARKRVVRTDHPEAGRRRMIGMPLDVGGVPLPKYRHAPCIGQHTDEILRELLGLSDGELSDLRTAQVLI